jgi:hypothetical protein
MKETVSLTVYENNYEKEEHCNIPSNETKDTW